MRLPTILTFAAAMLGFAQPLLGGGLLANLVTCEPLRLPALDRKAPVTPDSHDLDNPAMMSATSASILAEYGGENLLRTKTRGRLTTKVVTSGNLESVIVPIKQRKGETILALSKASSEGSLFHDHPVLGSRLSWNSDSYRWAIRRNLGSAMIGVTSAGSSGLCEGTSVYPQRVFGVLKGETDTRIRVNGSDSMIQLAFRRGGEGMISLTAGCADTGVYLDFADRDSLVSIPVEDKVANYGIDVRERLGRRTLGRIAYSWGKGSGENLMLLNGERVGRLQSWPEYSRMEVSLRHQKNPNSVWEVGYVSSERNLRLRGLNLDSGGGGLDLGSGDTLDFRAILGLDTSFYHAGVRRRVSNNWETSARYKLIRASAAVDGDYIARTFFGLISFTGIYQWDQSKSMIHGLELSATCTRGSISTTLRVEQLVPQQGHGSGSRHARTRKSTGGASVTLACGYAF